MQIINLTRAAITIFDENNKVKQVLPSEGYARLSNQPTLNVTVIDDIPVVSKQLDLVPEISGLPDQDPDKIFVADYSVAMAASMLGRADVIAPDLSVESIVRNPGGDIIGIKRLQTI